MIKEKSKELYKQTIKWIAISIILGIIVGLLVGLYNTLLSYANNYRKEKPWLIYFLPIAGILISYIYIKTKRNAYSGENLLKSEVQQAAKNIPFYMIIVSALGSLITTFFGGSAGKEGTAICIGGTIGDNISRILKVTEAEQKTIVICGVGSAFGVIYNVPFAGAILGMELVLKGKFHYQAILPSLMTSIVANETYLLLWNKSISYPEISLGEHNLFLIIKLILLGIIFGVVGIIFNYLLDNSSKFYEYFTKNPMIKGLIGGIITIILFLLVGDNYNGLGQNYISNSFLETSNLLDFVWKIIFTTVALGSVFQGGRGNPIFFVGATLGSAIAIYFNLPLEAVAALGMIGVFCTMTALPITAIIMFMEYFGSKEILGIIIIITICYMFSGYYDLITKNKMDMSKSNLLKGTIK